MTTINTNQKDWLDKALKHYAEKKPFEFVDGAGIGITANDLASAVKLLSSAKSLGLPWREITAALAGIGITGVGLWIILAAIADPEPTTKLGLLITGGILLALTGSLGTLAALGLRFHVEAKGPRGEAISVRPE